MRKKLMAMIVIVTTMICLLGQKVYADDVTLIGRSASSVGDHDHTSYMDNIDLYLSIMGYSDIGHVTSNISQDTIGETLRDSEIMVFRGHGNYMRKNGTLKYTYIETDGADPFRSDNMIYYMHLGYNAPACELAVYVGCNTAYGGVANSSINNLPVQSNNNGVDCSIGFRDTISCVAANHWTEVFFMSLANGNSVSRAMNLATMYACEDLNFVDPGISSCCCRGNASLSW